MNAKFETLIGYDTPTLIDFYATWCGPCQMLAPTLKAVKDRLGDRVVILKIDVDKNQELAASYQVRGVPTLMLYQRGKQLWRQSGLLSTEAIVQVILDKAATS
jgi:thioredoxin 1